MTQFITLVLMSFGSYFTSPATIESDENRTAITISRDGDDYVDTYGGTGSWEDE